MSEPIPESIPTSADPRSHRPLKRARGSNTAVASQANAITTLFLDPERPVNLPPPSSATKSSLAAPPEIVANVQGSSAGAGSGEFHVYKASRRREYERLRLMDEEAKKEDEDAKWAREQEERKRADEEKMKRNREKRNKKKGKKGKAGGKENGGVGGGDADEDHEQITRLSKGTNGVKKALQLPKRDGDDVPQQTNDVGMAKIAEEVGIVIHDDD